MKKTDHVVRLNYCPLCKKYTLTSFRITEYPPEGVPLSIKFRCIFHKKGEYHTRKLTRSGWKDLVENLAKQFMM